MNFKDTFGYICDYPAVPAISHVMDHKRLVHCHLFVERKFDNFGHGSSDVFNNPGRNSPEISLLWNELRRKVVIACENEKNCKKVLKTLGLLEASEMNGDTAPSHKRIWELETDRPHVPNYFKPSALVPCIFYSNRNCQIFLDHLFLLIYNAFI